MPEAAARDALGQGALGHGFGVDFPVVVHLDEGGNLGGMGGGGEGGVHFLHLAGGDEGADVHLFVQVPQLLEMPMRFWRPGVEGGEQVAGDADAAEAGGHEGGAVGDVGHRLRRRWGKFCFSSGLLLGQCGVHSTADRRSLPDLEGFGVIPRLVFPRPSTGSG